MRRTTTALCTALAALVAVAGCAGPSQPPAPASAAQVAADTAVVKADISAILKLAAIDQVGVDLYAREQQCVQDVAVADQVSPGAYGDSVCQVVEP